MGCGGSSSAEEAASPPASSPPPQQQTAPSRAGRSLPVVSPPSGYDSRELVLQRLADEDVESVRQALRCAPVFDLVSSPEVAAAEERLRSAKSLPQDWDMKAFAHGRLLEGKSGGRSDSAIVFYHSQSQEVMREVQALFDATYRKVYTRDRRGAPIPDRFVVKSVDRVLNDQVWREYVGKREEVRTRLGGATPTVPDGAQTMNHLAKVNATSLPPLDKSVNENWLFHGTTQAAAQGIAENDFRLDLSGSNAGTLYGKGIYLAENASKSDEYGEGAGDFAQEAEEVAIGQENARPPPGKAPPLVRTSYILLCRSLLGRVHYTDERKPDPDQLQQRCTRGEAESVLGDRLKRNGTFREIVVYSDDHVYPEFIVEYERIFFHERFAEIYKDMLEREKAKRFNGPTPEEREVLQSMWNVFGMPNKGRINKWQLLDLLKAIGQPPENEEQDLDETFKEWDTKKDGWIDWDEFMQEMVQRVKDGIEYD
mmetsp:Transcript_45900/g.106716  ORF Transcript_45900/g.106716 Transcript_45900/m.106716 type:complete len:482 (+) Transcript_45900:28-1473(+)